MEVAKLAGEIDESASDVVYGVTWSDDVFLTRCGEQCSPFSLG